MKSSAVVAQKKAIKSISFSSVSLCRTNLTDGAKLVRASEAGDVDLLRQMILDMEEEESVLGGGVLLKFLDWCNPHQANETALHRAAALGNDPIMAALLDAGATVDVRNFGGETPLHLATRFCHSTTLEALVRRGANLGALNSRGKTPEVLAEELCNYETALFLRSDAVQIQTDLGYATAVAYTPKESKEEGDGGGGYDGESGVESGVPGKPHSEETECHQCASHTTCYQDANEAYDADGDGKLDDHEKGGFYCSSCWAEVYGSPPAT